MSFDRLETYLDEMQKAALEIREFLKDTSRDAFLGDVMRQRAVGMNLLIIGENVVQLSNEYPDVVLDHPQIPWVKVRGMRNRIAHGYMTMNLDTVWDTAHIAIPDFIEKLHALRHPRDEGE